MDYFPTYYPSFFYGGKSGVQKTFKVQQIGELFDWALNTRPDFCKKKSISKQSVGYVRYKLAKVHRIKVRSTNVINDRSHPIKLFSILESPKNPQPFLNYIKIVDRLFRTLIFSNFSRSVLFKNSRASQSTNFIKFINDV